MSTELAKKHRVGEKTIRRDMPRAELHDADQETAPREEVRLLLGRVNCLTRKLKRLLQRWPRLSLTFVRK